MSNQGDQSNIQIAGTSATSHAMRGDDVEDEGSDPTPAKTTKSAAATSHAMRGDDVEDEGSEPTPAKTTKSAAATSHATRGDDVEDEGAEPTPAKKTKSAAASSQPERRHGKLRIGTFCEGPGASFALGVKSALALLGPNGRFVLTTVSDFNEDYLVKHVQEFPNEAKTLDATEATSYANVDIACVIAPYSTNLSMTKRLCNLIAAAISSSNTKYLLLGCREGCVPDQPKFGARELYGDLLTKFKWIGRLVPDDKRSLVAGYEHWFTAREPLRDAFLLTENRQRPYMYLVVLDTTKAFTHLLPETPVRSPFLSALVLIVNYENSQ